MADRSVPGGLSIGVVMVGTFLLIVVAAVTVSSGLAIRSGQQAVDGVIARLQVKTMDEVAGFLNRFLDHPYQLHRALLAHLDQGAGEEMAPCQRVKGYLRRYAQLGDRPHYHYYGGEDGAFCGLEIDGQGRWIVRESVATGQREVWSTTPAGERVERLEQEAYEPRQRPWYRSAVGERSPRWSRVYHFASRKGRTLGITAATPHLAADGSVSGVVATNLSLDEIGDFLATLRPSEHSHSFIIQRDGLLVASSDQQQSDSPAEQRAERLSASDSESRLVALAAAELERQSGGLERIEGAWTGSFSDSKRESRLFTSGSYYLMALPYSDPRGLDWLVVVVVPGSDFMGPIEHNGIVALILIVITVIVSVLLGIAIYSRLGRQIRHFSAITGEIAHGQLDLRLQVAGYRELRLLAGNFNLMVEQLQASFASLEEKVRQRTADLTRANHSLERHNLLIRNIFGRYISAEVMEELLASPEALKLGGERRRVTILTSDLRGFTALSEQISPEDVVRVLNHYLSIMGEVIDRHGGTINEFMGDGIVVFFGVPHPQQGDAERATACAIAMQNSMPAVNQKVVEWGLPPLQMGIGINRGDVVVGNIGSERRVKYSAVGSQMNLAFRIESYTVGGQVLISESTRLEIASPLTLASSRQITPKGVVEPVTIHEVESIGGEWGLRLEREEEVLAPLATPLRLALSPIDGKQVSAQSLDAVLVALGRQRARVELTDPVSLEGVVAIDGNLKIAVDGVDGALYARVVRIEKAELELVITSGREHLEGG